MKLLKNNNFLLVLMSATILAIPMPMLIILGGLAGLELAPDENLATLPVSVQMLAGLFAVAPMSVFMGRVGRRTGFLTAAAFALAGGASSALGLMTNTFLLLCIGHALLGAAVVSFNLFRFAAAELVDSSMQPTAISITLGSGLVAALLAPEVFNSTRGMLPESLLAGPYWALCGLSVIGAAPLIFAQFAAPQPKPTSEVEITNKPKSIFQRPQLIWAIVCGAGSAAGMTLLMTPTPIAMVGDGFTHSHAGDVIRWHVIAMFAPSFVTGAIISRIGANTVVIIGAALLAASGVIAILGTELVNYYVSLILLGVGWNFGFVGATALLNAELSADERPLYQGINDTTIALGGTIASFSSGLMLASLTWQWIAAVLIALSTTVGLSSFNQARYSMKRLALNEQYKRRD